MKCELLELFYATKEAQWNRLSPSNIKFMSMLSTNEI